MRDMGSVLLVSAVVAVAEWDVVVVLGAAMPVVLPDWCGMGMPQTAQR